MNKFNITSIMILLFVITTLCSCTQQPENSNSKINENLNTIRNVEGLEEELIEIMSQADLVPYYEKQIKLKKMKEEKQKKESKNTDNKEGSSQQNSGSNKKEFKPEPVTNNDILLTRLLEQEKSYKIKEPAEKKIPEDIVFIWDKINKGINKLHLKWSDMKSQFEKESIPSRVISGFDSTLNSLTAAGSENDYLQTLIKTNTLTTYISQFIKELNHDTLSSIYAIKYHTRNIVLNVARNNYSSANRDINLIKNEEETLNSELKNKKSSDSVDKLTTSISSLEEAISLKDINVIKIKASIVIKNLNTIKENLSLV